MNNLVKELDLSVLDTGGGHDAKMATSLGRGVISLGLNGNCHYLSQKASGAKQQVEIAAKFVGVTGGKQQCAHQPHYDAG